MSATTKAASSPKPCGASRSRWCCSTRSKRRTPTSSTRCSRSSKTAGSPTAQGRAVDFKNTILIMTSNLGTSDLRKAAIGFGKGSDSITHERMKEKVNQALKAHFRPEFLNRIDDTIVFHELTKQEVMAVADLFITRLRDQLATQGLGLELSAKAQGFLAEKGYDPELGARPLRRAVQQYVEDALSEKILFKEFHAGQTIVVDIVEGPDGTVAHLRRRRGPSAVGRLRRLRPTPSVTATPSLQRVKSRIRYVCRLCGTVAPRWQGRCGGCGEWNSIDEVTAARRPPASRTRAPRARCARCRAATAPRASRQGSANWTGCSAADSSPDRPRCSTANPGWASRRSP